MIVALLFLLLLADLAVTWISSGKRTDPLTNAVLADTRLVPNNVLRSQIQAWRAAAPNIHVDQKPPEMAQAQPRALVPEQERGGGQAAQFGSVNKDEEAGGGVSAGAVDSWGFGALPAAEDEAVPGAASDPRSKSEGNRSGRENAVDQFDGEVQRRRPLCAQSRLLHELDPAPGAVEAVVAGALHRGGERSSLDELSANAR